MSKTLKYFKEVLKYPRPSKKEEKIRVFLIDFFDSKWYKYIIDKIWNLIVYIPAKNTLSKEIVILQSHMDMVCVKTNDSKHNFLTDTIKTYEKNGFLFARDTSLWADNGIWIALSMVSIDFETHPALELVFTVDEEDWMSWISELDYSLLSWTKVLNLDSEDEDEICISSAWWIGINWNKKIDFEKWKLQKYNLELFWMKWWHSWVEINENRWNTILVFLDFISKNLQDIEIYKIEAWVASNVIPSRIFTTLWIKNISKFEIKFKDYINKLTYDCPNIDFKISENNEDILAIKNLVNILKDLTQIKDWVYSMSEKIPSLVQTSMNLWILKIDWDYLKVTYLARSSNNDELNKLSEDTKWYLLEKWFELDFDRGYPGWQDDPDSNLLNKAKKEYEKILWEAPKITAIHAWLESWALVSWLKSKSVNAISIWPNIKLVHSVDEKVELSSVEKIEQILSWILKNL